MKKSPPLAAVFRKQLPIYLNGQREALDECFELLGKELADGVPSATPLCESLLNRAVELKDVALLNRLIELEPAVDLQDQALAAGQSGWKEGYDALRAQMSGDIPVIGISLLTAFQMGDPNACSLVGSKLMRAQQVQDFMIGARERGISNDEVIDFLENSGLTWAVDFGLGLVDEWANRKN